MRYSNSQLYVIGKSEPVSGRNDTLMDTPSAPTAFHSPAKHFADLIQRCLGPGDDRMLDYVTEVSKGGNYTLSIAVDLLTNGAMATELLATKYLHEWARSVNQYVQDGENFVGNHPSKTLNDNLMTTFYTALMAKECGKIEGLDLEFACLWTRSIHSSRPYDSEEVLADAHYWRGLALASIINVTHNRSDSSNHNTGELREFIVWHRGRNVKEVFRAAVTHKTLNTMTIESVIDLRTTTHQSLFEGIL